MMGTARSGKSVSVPMGLGLSLAMNVVITTVSAVVIAVMVEQGKIAWEAVGYWIMFTILTSSFVGTRVAISSIKTQAFMVAIMSGTVFWVCLLCMTALFFGGNYSSVFETALLIFGGSITAALIKSPNGKTLCRKNRNGYR